MRGGIWERDEGIRTAGEAGWGELAAEVRAGRHPAELAGAVGIAHQHKTGFYSIEQPLAVKRRNIRAHTCLNNHGFAPRQRATGTWPWEMGLSGKLPLFLVSYLFYIPVHQMPTQMPVQKGF